LFCSTGGRRRINGQPGSDRIDLDQNTLKIGLTAVAERAASGMSRGRAARAGMRAFRLCGMTAHRTMMPAIAANKT
jgi:hypothetical protein